MWIIIISCWVKGSLGKFKHTEILEKVCTPPEKTENKLSGAKLSSSWDLIFYRFAWWNWFGGLCFVGLVYLIQYILFFIFKTLC